MKKSIYPIAVIILFIASAFVSFPTQEWKILEATSIKFESSHPSGVFKNFKGTIILDEKDLSNSKFDVTIDVASISTGNGMMNKKAQTEEWFNADKYPQIMYSTSKIEKSDDGVVLFGELKMKGKVKPTKINLKIDEKGNKATYTGSFNVDRIYFGVGKKSESVPDVMKVSFEIPVIKK